MERTGEKAERGTIDLTATKREHRRLERLMAFFLVLNIASCIMAGAVGGRYLLLIPGSLACLGYGWYVRREFMRHFMEPVYGEVVNVIDNSIFTDALNGANAETAKAILLQTRRSKEGEFQTRAVTTRERL